MVEIAGAGATLMFTEADLVGSAMEVAVTVTVVLLATFAGAW